MARTARALQQAPHTAMLDLHRRYGPVCKVGLGPLTYVLLFGRDANEYVLSTNVDNFRWREAFEVLIPIDGDTALAVTDGDEHKRRRRLVQPAFHGRRIAGYLDLMVEEADTVIDGWRPGETVDVYGAFRDAVRRMVVRSLFGEPLQARADELGAHLQPAIDFVNKPPYLQWKVGVPGTGWRQAKRGLERADAIVYGEIDRRRAMPASDGDVLGMLLEARDEEGEALSDVEVRDQVVSLIAAGYDTTSAAAAWAAYALLANPAVAARALAEIEETIGDRVLTANDIARLRYLDAFVSETLRLYSPAVVAGRMAVDAFDFAGHTIPAGSLVLYSQYVTHRLPELWPDPEAFRPERWDKEPVPYSYLPFGGGYRRCIGFAMAILEMKAIVVQLLRRTSLELAPQKVEPTGLTAMHPKHGVRVRVKDVRSRGTDARTGP